MTTRESILASGMGMPSRRSVLRGSLGIAAALAGGNVLAACGGGGDSGEGPITIGGISDLSGDLAPLGIAQKQMGDLAIAKLNADGGVLGRKVKIEYLDGATDPSAWALRAKRLLDRPMVIGGLTGAERNAVKDIITARTMFITPGYTENPSANCLDMMYAAGAGPDQFIVPLVEYIVKKSGGDTVYVLGSDYDYPRGNNKLAIAKFKELGVKVVGEDYYPLNATSFSPAVRKISSAKPAIVYSNVIPPTCYTLLKQLHEAGLWGKFLFATPGSDEGWIAGGGDVTSGVYACMDYFDSVDDKVSTEIRKAYYDKFGRKYPISSAGSATGVYRGIMLWADAVEKAGSTDPKKVSEKMSGASTDQAPGGPAEMPKGSHNAKLPTYIGQLGPDGVQIVEKIEAIDPPSC